MEPKITITKNNEQLHFTAETNVSIINAIGRILKSDIPVVCVRTKDYDTNQCNILENTSRFTNEIIKHRMSLIPIHIKPGTMDINNYVIYCEKENNTNETIYLTTEDLTILDKETKKPLDTNVIRKIFPPDRITQRFIDIIRLRPKISNTIPGERIKFECSMTISTARENSSFNSVSTVAHSNTIDGELANAKWKEYENKLESKDNIDYIKTNWFLLDAKRYYKPDTFDFKMETIGVYTNIELVKLACDIIMEKASKLKENLETGNLTIKKSTTTIKNCYDIILVNETYTLGKILEYIIYTNYFVQNETVSYISFGKLHPHDNNSILRIAFNELNDENTIIYEYLLATINSLTEIFNKIKSQL